MTHQTKEAGILAMDSTTAHPVLIEFCETTSLASVSINLFKMYGMSMENPSSANLQPMERREMAEECIRLIEVVNALEKTQDNRKFMRGMHEWRDQLSSSK